MKSNFKNIFVRVPTFFGQLLPWLILAFILLYTYARFFVAPYPGFNFVPASGKVDRIYVANDPNVGLQIGDKLLKIGPVLYEEYDTNLRQTLFDSVQPGQIVPILVERNGQQVEVNWEFPGATWDQVFRRLSGAWGLSIVLWFFGTIIFLFTRPKDTLWQLLVAAAYLTSIWILAGTLSATAIWHSAIILRMGIWLCVPVYLHLHWIFPQPLAHFPRWGGWIIYLVAVIFAIAEWFQLLPPPTYFLGFLLAFGGSLGLLIAHAVARPDQRKAIGMLSSFLGLAIIPIIISGIAGLIEQNERLASLALLGTPAIPLAYLYTAFRRRLGIWELRTNRGITLLIFLVMLVLASSLAFVTMSVWFNFPDEVFIVGVASVLVAGLISISFYRKFQHWIEKRLFRIPQSHVNLLEVYSERITTTLSLPDLVHLLNDEILPGLLVRQSALVQLEETRINNVIYANGIPENGMRSADASTLLAHLSQFHPALESVEGQFWSWVRLALPLILGDRVIGLWLLGRRDPDDYYAQSEISVLQSMANQTAIALSNILQTERLQSLYRANVGREEAERVRMARELHDDVLGQMALLAMSADNQSHNVAFEQAYRTATLHVREVINSLRPAMLNYGLRSALEELTDNMFDLANGIVHFEVDVPQSVERYPLEVETYIYRIIQQACQNAIQHARPTLIRIFGQLQVGEIYLTVEDDGVGFSAGESLDLVNLLTKKHYGMAGMYERAVAINAQLLVDSALEKGTRVQISWSNLGLTN